MIEILSCLLFCVAMYGSPGPATLSLASSGMSNGFRSSLGYLTGIVSGVIATLAITLSGLFALVNASEVFAQVLRIVGFTYIVYLGWKIARSTPNTNISDGAPLKFGNGLLLNVLNPKAYVAAAVVYSQFESSLPVLTVALLVIATAITVDTAWCLVGTTIRRLNFSTKSLQRLNYLFGTLLVAVAVTSLFL